jgi:hypothetical protein
MCRLLHPARSQLFFLAFWNIGSGRFIPLAQCIKPTSLLHHCSMHLENDGLEKDIVHWVNHWCALFTRISSISWINIPRYFNLPPPLQILLHIQQSSVRLVAVRNVTVTTKLSLPNLSQNGWSHCNLARSSRSKRPIRQYKIIIDWTEPKKMIYHPYLVTRSKCLRRQITEVGFPSKK